MTDESAAARKTRVALLFGGRSGEHAISCATAASVLTALDRRRYEVLPIGITRSGQWVLMPDDPGPLQLDGDVLPEVPEAAGELTLPMGDKRREVLVTYPDRVPEALGEVDVVFPLLHGPFGEDGTLQGLLELAQIPYVGSGVLSSAVAMDKHYMKVVLAGHGLPVGPYTVIHPHQWRTDKAAALDAARSLGSPLFVKPARAGSSLGITKVTDVADLEGAIIAAQEHDPKVVIESQVVGREIECGVLGAPGGTVRTSLPGEIKLSDGEFYDFAAKYLDTSGVELSCPADLPQETTEAVRQLAASAFAALGCEGLARVDFFVRGPDDIVINEVNTMPGFTPYSMYPLMWQRSGMAYEELVAELIDLAVERPLGLR